MIKRLLTKKKLAAIFGIVILLFILNWFYSHSTIEIKVKNLSGTKAVIYNLYDQGSQKTTKIQGSSGQVKKTVPRANYEVLVTQGEKSFLGVTKTKGFLGKTTLEVNLVEEKGRKFVGNDPEPCMKLVAETLVSYECGDLFSSLGIHIPAESGQPTYVQKSTSSLVYGKVESIIDTKEGTLAFLKADARADEEVNSAYGHFAYYLGANLEIKERVEWPGLAADKSYSFTAYQDGFIAYTSNYDQVLVFTGAASQPKTVTIAKPDTKNLSGQGFDVQNDSYLVLYSNVSDTKSKKKRSEIVVSNGSKSSRHLVFGAGFKTVRFCGNSKLCALEGSDLRVYDIGGKKPELLYSVNKVKALENTAKGFVVVRDNEVLGLDIENRKGSIEYSYGDYRFSGMRKDGFGYILALTNNKGRKVALYIDRTGVNQDSIDKKMAELQKIAEVSSVSIYDTSIFIAPELGDPVANKTTGKFDYDPKILKSVNAKINEKISQLGINKTVYTIFNPFDY